MKTACPRPHLLLLVLLSVFILPTGIRAADGDDAYEAVTAADPSIDLNHLELLLQPLTRDELQVEADAWLALLKAKAAEISAAEIAVKFVTKQIEEAEEKAEEAEEKAEEEAPTSEDSTTQPAAPAAEDAKKAAEVEAAAQTQVKEEKIKGVGTLREQRDSIIGLLDTVLTAYVAKGGDRADYDLYVDAVRGLHLDTSDWHGMWITIVDWLKRPDGGLQIVKKIALFVGTLVVFWILGRIVGRVVRRAVSASKALSDLMRQFLVKITSRTIYLIGFIVALSQLEVNIGPFVAAIGAAGFVVAFALQGTLSNFASGLMILMYRPFDVGDVVNVAGVAGKVESMSLVSTTVLTFDNQQMVIPNNAIWGSVITNVTGKNTRRVDLVFGIAYDDDQNKAMTILDEVVKKHSLVLSDPAPVIKLHELADSSVNFVCRPWVKTADYWTAYWDITQSVKEEFDKQGISIPFPQRDVHVHQVAASAT